MNTLLDLIHALHEDGRRVRRERKTKIYAARQGSESSFCGRKPIGPESGIDEHHIAIGSAGPSLAEESNTSW